MAIDLDRRLDNERAHGVFLARNPGKYWGHSSRAGHLRVERRVRLFIEAAGLRPGKRICEIGCGTGIFTRRLRECSGATIVGVDVSPELLDIAKKESAGDAGGFFVLGDCMNPEGLGIELDFDAVVTNSVLHHLDTDLALAAIFRMLRPGGVFICTEPNMLNPQIALQKNIPAIKKFVGDSPDETAFFRWAIVEAMRNKGFVEVVAKPFDFLHPKLPDSLAGPADKMLRVFESIPGLREIAGSLLITGKKPR